MKPHKFSVSERLQSFRYAFNGIRIMIQGEHNSWIHLTVALIVIIAGFVFSVDKMEWIALVFAVGLVLALELINSAIEKLADFVSPSKDELIRKAKDLSAAGVLIGSLTAAAIGLIIFLPKIFGLLWLR
jgi:diacylglycerol kinase